MNKDKILAAIEAQDGLIDNKYVYSCNYCAIGALAVYAEIEIPEELRYSPGDSDPGISQVVAEPFLNKLCAAYECDDKTLIDLQTVNDYGYFSPDERKTRIISWIKGNL